MILDIVLLSKLPMMLLGITDAFCQRFIFIVNILDDTKKQFTIIIRKKTCYRCRTMLGSFG
ncbi:hypothetical protein CR164_08550 [Prosthecochloris marina]|uniref:Uncharacterized protein n=1 Tax=Prosthecochloris marina TaxID=2017681 RepID=A0A317T5E3_9CHLB|nr:hypothetical protein CR164_08550 [Prosthecochloris marina]